MKKVALAVLFLVLLVTGHIILAGALALGYAARGANKTLPSSTRRQLGRRL